MGDLGYLSKQLEDANKHSTSVGKIWLTVLLVFRILLIKFAVGSVWEKDQDSFLCDTNQPGCKNVCYDKTFPMSHTRFWVMQILFVSSPTLIYLGYSIHQKGMENKPNHSTNESAKDNQDTWFKINVLCIILKILFEVTFLIAHYLLYGLWLKPMYTCNRWPCLNTVFCYISRPTEKTIFIIFMLIMACVSLLHSMVDMYYLAKKQNERKKRKGFTKKCGKKIACESQNVQSCL